MLPDLAFQVEGVEAVPFSASPVLAFRLRISDKAGRPIQAVVLRAQIQIEVTRRRYSPEEQKRLIDLFGAPERWGESLHSMLWTLVSASLPAFEGNIVMDLQVPCTFDFNVAATKYFHGLTDGEVPLMFYFSGSVLYAGESGALQVIPISWEKEASFRLPVRVWRELIESHYADSVWLSLRKDAFERLYQYKLRNGIPTWEQTLDRVLDGVEESATL